MQTNPSPVSGSEYKIRSKASQWSRVFAGLLLVLLIASSFVMLKVLEQKKDPYPAQALDASSRFEYFYTLPKQDWRKAEWSPDGGSLALSNEAGNILIWDAKTGQSVSSREVITPVHDLKWSHDANMIAVGSYSNTISLIDTTDGRVVRTFTVPLPEGIPSVSNYTGRPLICCSFFMRVLGWLPDEPAVVTFTRISAGATHEGGRFDPAPEPDGVRYYFMDVWDASTGTLLRRSTLITSEVAPKINRPVEDVGEVTLSPDGNTIAALAFLRSNNSHRESYNIKLIDAHTGTIKHTVPVTRYDGSGPDYQILFWSPDGKRIAFSTPLAVNVVDVSTGTIVRTLPDVVPPTYTPVVHRGFVEIKPEPTDAPPLELMPTPVPTDEKSLREAAPVPSSEPPLPTATHPKWPTRTPLPTRTADANNYTRIIALSWSPDSRHLSTYDSEAIRVWSVERGQLDYLVSNGESEYHHQDQFVWLADGSLLMSVQQGEIVMWDPGTGRYLGKVQNKTYAFYVKWSPDGRTFIIFSSNGSAEMWGVK